jgi:myo-inositol-1-phosphate synthase
MKNFRINDYELQLRAIKVKKVSQLNTEGVVLNYDRKTDVKKNKKTSSLEMTVTMNDENGQPYRITVIAYTSIHQTSAAYDGLRQNILYRYAKYCLGRLSDSLPVTPTLLDKFIDVKKYLRKKIQLPVTPITVYTKVDRPDEDRELLIREG